MVSYAFKTPPQHGSWADFLAVWKAADEIDVFESGWTMDHFYPLTPPFEGPHLESWAMLPALAQATKRLRLGCMVNGMHYRHPAVTANLAATLDHISSGRFTLGMGAGWNLMESDAYGIKLGTLRERFDRFDEGIEVIVSMLANETTTFDGSYYQLKDARCEPKPLQQPLPLAIGGTGPKRTLRAVARWANHWDMVGAADPSVWRRANEVLLGHCAAIGRDPAEILRSVHVMWPAEADPKAVADRGAAFAAEGVDLIIFSMRGPYEVRLLEPLAQVLRDAG